MKCFSKALARLQPREPLQSVITITQTDIPFFGVSVVALESTCLPKITQRCSGRLRSAGCEGFIHFQMIKPFSYPWYPVDTWQCHFAGISFNVSPSHHIALPLFESPWSHVLWLCVFLRVQRFVKPWAGIKPTALHFHALCCDLLNDPIPLHSCEAMDCQCNLLDPLSTHSHSALSGTATNGKSDRKWCRGQSLNWN